MKDKIYTIRKISDGCEIPIGTISKAEDYGSMGYRLIGGKWNGWNTHRPWWELYNEPSILPPELFEI